MTLGDLQTYLFINIIYKCEFSYILHMEMTSLQHIIMNSHREEISELLNSCET